MESCTPNLHQNKTSPAYKHQNTKGEEYVKCGSARDDGRCVTRRYKYALRWPPDKFITRKCTEDKPLQCQTCHPGTFNMNRDDSPSCEDCMPACGSQFRVLHYCNSTSDLKCECNHGLKIRNDQLDTACFPVEGKQNRWYIICMLLFSVIQVSYSIELFPIKETIISTYYQQVDLVWIYRDSSPHKIRFTRGNLENDIRTTVMAEWTSTTGFNVDAFYPTPLAFNYHDDDEQIKLKLKHTNREDFDHIYYCDIIMNDGKNITSSIKLKTEVPSYNSTNQINVRVGDEAAFKAQYTYRYLATMIIFRRKNRETGTIIEALGYWIDDIFTEYEPFKGRLKFNKLTNSPSSENITLVINNIANTELNQDYECDIILGDGQEIHIYFTLEKKEIMSTFEMNLMETVTRANTHVVVVVISSSLAFILTVVVIFFIVFICRIKFMKIVSNRSSEAENNSMI